MYSLVEIGILNALTAGVLAIVVLLIGRALRRPAIVHALWVLVLLKLVTPPIFEIPVGLRLERLATLTEAGRDGPNVAQPQRSMVAPAASTVPVVVFSDANDLEAASQTATDQSSLAAAPISIEMVPLQRGVNLLAPEVLRRFLAITIPILLWIWVAGMVVWFVIQGWRIGCFMRLTGGSRLACDDIQSQAQQLGLSIGVRRAPQICVLDATMSPILWAVGSRARIIFPADLLERVDAEARATLLTHELAHFRRGDHWVRLLEFAVTGLFWWHPAVWVARREIEISEEHCCDAWVVAQFPGQPRRYAEALLDTIDFLSEDRPRTVPVASGLGQAPFLRERIRLIMSGVAPKSMSGTTRLAVLASAAILLPLGPQIFEGAIRQADAALASSRALSERISQVEREPSGSTAAVRLDAPPSAQDSGDARRDESTAAAPEIDQVSTGPAVNTSVAWTIANSRDGRFQAIAKTGGEFVLRDTFERQSFDLSEFQIASIAFAPHRDLLAAGSADSKVYLFDCASGEPVGIFTGHQSEVGSLAVSPDSRFVVSGSRDGVVKLWDIDYEREVSNRIPIQSTAINCVRFSSDGRLLAIACGDWMTSQGGTVALWDLRGGIMRQQIKAQSPIGAIAFGPGQLVIAEWSGRTTNWNLRTRGSSAASPVDKDTVSAAAFAAGAQKLLFAAANGEQFAATAPAWFQRMDRDDDGRLGWKEFLGPRGTFRKLDVDADEVVSLAEVTALQ